MADEQFGDNDPEDGMDERDEGFVPMRDPSEPPHPHADLVAGNEAFLFGSGPVTQ
jgi:hypothetical protein